MDKESNIYTISYAVVMTLIVAISLAFVSTGLKTRQDDNQRLAAKIDILKAVGYTDLAKADADNIFN